MPEIIAGGQPAAMGVLRMPSSAMMKPWPSRVEAMRTTDRWASGDTSRTLGHERAMAAAAYKSWVLPVVGTM